jgi:hypothetical protein
MYYYLLNNVKIVYKNSLETYNTKWTFQEKTYNLLKYANHEKILCTKNY